MHTARLSPAALALRVAHGAIAVAFLLGIAYIWWCALTDRRGALLRITVTALVGESAAVLANHGDCPLGGLQEQLGDPVPLFELLLSPAAARRAVPALGAVTAAGLALLARRSTGKPEAHRTGPAPPNLGLRPVRSSDGIIQLAHGS